MNLDDDDLRAEFHGRNTAVSKLIRSSKDEKPET
jgi:hypothetical protein